MTADAGRVDAFRQRIGSLLAEAKLPAAEGPTTITLPVVVVG